MERSAQFDELEQLEKNLDRLRRELSETARKAGDILSLLQDERTPDKSKRDALFDGLARAAEVEELVITGLTAVRKGRGGGALAPGAATAAGYRELVGKLRRDVMTAERERQREALEKFVRITVDGGEARYEAGLKEYLDEAADLIARLKNAIKQAQAGKSGVDRGLDERLPAFLAMVEILEDDDQSGEGPLYDTVLDAFSGRIVQGLTLGKYRLEHDARGKGKKKAGGQAAGQAEIPAVVPAPAPAAGTARAAADAPVDKALALALAVRERAGKGARGAAPAPSPAPVSREIPAGTIYDVVNKNIEVNVQSFRKQLMKTTVDALYILITATWFIYFTLRDLMRLFPRLRLSSVEESLLAESLDRLADKGYLASFRVGGRDAKSYTLCANMKRAFLKPEIQTFARQYAGMQPAMRDYVAPLANLTLRDLEAVEARNRAYLEALTYLGERLEKASVLTRVLDHINCNIFCFFAEKPGIVFLSSEMVGEPAADDSDETYSLRGFLLKHPAWTLVASDAGETWPASEKLRLPNQWLSLKGYCQRLIDEGAALLTQETEDREADDDDGETPEALADRLMSMNPTRDGEAFYTLCDSLVSRLLDEAESHPGPETGTAPDRMVQAVGFLKALIVSASAPDSGWDPKWRARWEMYGRLVHLATAFEIEPGLEWNNDTLSVAVVGTANDKSHYPCFMGLLIATVLRAMFAPSRSWDYDLYENVGKLFADTKEWSQRAGSLKNVIGELLKLKDTENGFSRPVLAFFAEKTSSRERAQEFARRAAMLKTGPTVKARINGMEDFTRLCFGPESGMFQAMEAIEKIDGGDLFGRDAVSAALETVKDNRALDDLIDTTWKQVRTRGDVRVRELACAARQQITGWLQKQRDLMREWLEFSGNQVESVSDEIRRIRENLLKEIPPMIDTIERAGPSGSSFILDVLRDFLAALSDGEIPRRAARYAEFLHSCWIETGSDLAPEFPAEFEALPGMEAWRLAVRHIMDWTPLDAVLERIKDREQLFYYDNIGQCRQIEEFLGTPEEQRARWDANRSRIETAARSDEEDFFAAMELAFAYGRIEERVKEKLLADEERFRAVYWESGNFGRFRMALSKFKEAVEDQRGVIGNRLKARLDNAAAAYPAPTGDPAADAANGAALVRETRRLLENANFAVAEEYLNRLDSGDGTLPQEDAVEEIDFFGRFLEAHEGLYRLCLGNKGGSLRNWAPEAVTLNPDWEQAQRDSARRLEENWLNRKQSVTADEIKAFFEELGFAVIGVDRQSVDPHLVFSLRAKAAEVNLMDYRHPIAAFGTRMAPAIPVICLFGDHSVAELIDIIVQQLHLGSLAFVLCDTPSSLKDRRQLVEAFHKTSGQHSFLFIDQVLTLYLAGLDRGERMAALLKCALPYTYYQPFSGGAGIIPEEMFYGRKSELETILAPEGANIVYGGRQLGKTALLERARSVAHKAAAKECAAYVEIAGRTPGAALDAVIGEINAAAGTSRPLIDAGKIATWEDLAAKLRELLDANKIRRLLLLIDETDRFLEADAKDDYQTVQTLVTLARQTQNRFKFVLAGLHNVARSRKALARNGVFGQLRTLCVKPLSPRDALGLLKRPLSYLGFRMDHLQQLELILANTNYYPGVLQFFGEILIKTLLSERYGEYYDASRNPPYDLDDDQLRRIFSDKGLNEAIKQRIGETLNCDPRYRVLANILAFRYYEDMEAGVDPEEGYTAHDVRDYIKSENIKSLARLSLEETRNLLLELADMGILWPSADESRFRFRRANFLAIIGTSDAVTEFLIEAAEDQHGTK